MEKRYEPLFEITYSKSQAEWLKHFVKRKDMYIGYNDFRNQVIIEEKNKNENYIIWQYETKTNKENYIIVFIDKKEVYRKTFSGDSIYIAEFIKKFKWNDYK